MKTAKEWSQETLTTLSCRSQEYVFTLIQADALRHAAKLVENIVVKDEPWEDGERIITVNGSPIGGTVENPDAERWSLSLLSEISKLIAMRADALASS